jgi:hypothetical protein
LESLQTVTALGLLADNIEYRVNELCTFCVVTFGPVVSGSALSEDKVVWTEDLSEWTRSDGVHCARLQVNQDGTRYIFAACGFIVIHIDSL